MVALAIPKEVEETSAPTEVFSFVPALPIAMVLCLKSRQILVKTMK